MKATTTKQAPRVRSLYQFTPPPQTTAEHNAFLAKHGAKEFSFELWFKGKVVRGEAITLGLTADKEPDPRDLKEGILETLNNRRILPSSRRGWSKARFTFTLGPTLTHERLALLYTPKWTVEDAA